ncbi:hypothetical protein EXIGLDRAFT_784346 [Exidia glandulosa HHB12029]|uniref:Uncharacterized protein n=1 Tax=Exidia glandulosa HHB12029 TaxID=1314781 RepID=A0A166MIG3_EXIGL|nr:hypothetical protein EXIGLDRAFT_784346 [Exidia glandulosa HHB12029]
MLAHVPSLAPKMQLVAYRLAAALQLLNAMLGHAYSPFAPRSMCASRVLDVNSRCKVSIAVNRIRARLETARVFAVFEVDLLESTRDIPSIAPPQPNLTFKEGVQGAVLEVDLPVRVMLESDSKSLVECKDVLTLRRGWRPHPIFTYRETRMPSFEVPRVAVVEILRRLCPRCPTRARLLHRASQSSCIASKSLTKYTAPALIALAPLLSIFRQSEPTIHPTADSPSSCQRVDAPRGIYSTALLDSVCAASIDPEAVLVVVTEFGVQLPFGTPSRQVPLVASIPVRVDSIVLAGSLALSPALGPSAPSLRQLGTLMYRATYQNLVTHDSSPILPRLTRPSERAWAAKAAFRASRPLVNTDGTGAFERMLTALDPRLDSTFTEAIRMDGRALARVAERRCQRALACKKTVTSCP